MGAFDLLSDEILSALRDFEIEDETEPQEETIPHILAGENVLVIAPTGIGKTEAAILPVMDRILKNPGPGFRVLYITPLRALNRDMLRRLEDFSRRLDFTVGVRHGDTSGAERRKQSLHPPDFLVTTPETLQIMFTGRRLREALRNVEHVVVDELNELAVDERGSQLSLALERLLDLRNGKEFQRIGLSATVGSPRKVLEFLVGVGRKGKIVEISEQREMEAWVEYPVEMAGDREISEIMRCEPQKAAGIRRCRELMDEHVSTLLFVNTRDSAEFIGSSFNLWDEGYELGVHHGSLSKDARIDVEERFKSGELKALICTSSMELGIDVGATDMVIQYQSPRQVTRYVQRIGRSGHRIGKVPKGCIITANGDDIAEAAVITRRALARELELTDIPEKPMSVLANQVISAVHCEGKIRIDALLETVKRAYPFRDLHMEELSELVDQLAEIKALWREGKELGKRRRSLSYFYENISMIPDERTFLLRNTASNKIVGTLDESFVASHVEIGGVVILQGKAWQIVDIEEDRVLASPVGDIGRIPDWSGEDIPVPLEVAREVGVLRRDGIRDHPVAPGARDAFQDYMTRQGSRAFATEHLMVLEMEGEIAVINACLGTRINETLGNLVASLLSARLGDSVALHVDPYRMMFKLPRSVPRDWIRDILLKTEPEIVGELLKKTLVNSSFFRWMFLHVAKKFGAVKRDVDYRSVSLDRLMEVFRDTPLYREALDKTFRDHMDVVGAQRVLSMIREGSMEIISSPHGLSPISEVGLDDYREFLRPEKVSRAVLMAFKERLWDERMTMKCLKCGSGRKKRVRDVKKPSCPRCGSAMVAPLLFYHDEGIVDRDITTLSPKEMKKLKEYYKLADLARVYQRRALMAIAARGVGHDKAGKILGRAFSDEEEFLRTLLKAEIQYARTKRFWD